MGRMLEGAVELQPDAILVAHSLGCVLAAHLAARYPDLQIKAALLVAPADVDSARHTPPHIRGFAPIPRQPLPFCSIVVASTNDPYITIGRATRGLPTSLMRVRSGHQRRIGLWALGRGRGDRRYFDRASRGTAR
jgi:predicted alpha/beta hydrolase family esterase